MRILIHEASFTRHKKNKQWVGSDDAKQLFG